MIENWFGLGKNRSKFGKWLDQHGIPQKVIAERSNVSKSTISNMCSDPKYMPSLKTASKVIKEVKKLDKSIKYEDFWT
ncbi:helix-turn-helix domain-containing protein [Priestia megaterium]|uniref:helix-turn-helix domain-containing protein n=1 Tax=Priestia megaterium TaxID=1404 RepID=UPI00234F3999|nr:helix-turn-helix transcriptional regulator [Priestia megaterium]MDC7783879.1 helix-turn-helix transcriptional regulator [Priestia megaterium]